MHALTELPNIGKILAKKLQQINIENESDLKKMGSIDAIIALSGLENSGACLNMLFALEGAIQGIRWHGLDKEKKDELKALYKTLEVNEK